MFKLKIRDPLTVGDTNYKLTLSYIAIALAMSGRLAHCLNQDESGIQESYNRAKTDQTRCNESTYYSSPRNQGCSLMNMNHAWISVRTHTCLV